MTIQSFKILSIGEITASIKDLIEGKFRFVAVRGQISNLKTPYSGHSYFTLKDENAQIRAVMFKNQQRYLTSPLKDGEEIICHGRISLYEPRGEYQIILDSVENAGTGTLQIEFERVKKMLEQKGYFDPKNKMLIPPFVKKIAVISSATGAALKDFLKVAELRANNCHIQILPVRVQGVKAAEEIADALRIAQQIPNLDTIVLCRGGGSIEDLWAFNEVKVAEAIFQSQIPVVSGVGHQTDFTISDFCADVRCATPTAAAELLLPDLTVLRTTIEGLQKRQARHISYLLQNYTNRIQQAAKGLLKTEDIVEKSLLRLELTSSYLRQALLDSLSTKEVKVEALTARLHAQAPQASILLQQERLGNITRRLQGAITNTITEKSSSLANQASLLQGVSPLATLSRGYSVTKKVGTQGTVITSSSQVRVGDNIKILLHEGSLEGTITKKE